MSAFDGAGLVLHGLVLHLVCFCIWVVIISISAHFLGHSERSEGIHC